VPLQTVVISAKIVSTRSAIIELAEDLLLLSFAYFSLILPGIREGIKEIYSCLDTQTFLVRNIKNDNMGLVTQSQIII